MKSIFFKNKDHPEIVRLAESETRKKHWKRWGPYLSDRQWGTVREDYSPHGTCWDYFTHEHSRSRVYRWGEDGIFGISDSKCRLCFSLALWNTKDQILKERFFGLTGNEGNHGEDVKECYYYLESLPSHSYMKALYKYPQAAFPYQQLVDENKHRGLFATEYELIDTGVFDQNRYFDVFVEYAKNSSNDILIKVTAHNRGPEDAELHLIPTLWFRNTWSWGRQGEGYDPEPIIKSLNWSQVLAEHCSLGKMVFAADTSEYQANSLFTYNETNFKKVFGGENSREFVKDAFHDYIIEGKKSAVNPELIGTKQAFQFPFSIPAGGSKTIKLRLVNEDELPGNCFDTEFDKIFEKRIQEHNTFYQAVIPDKPENDNYQVMKQAYAGLLWNKQFYYYSIKEWSEGDPAQPKPDPGRKGIRNSEWSHLYNRDVISMPDKWEYPWYAAWDLAFHMVTFSRVDPEFAKDQLILFLREWYMHPNGQIPAYEFSFSDVNPPVHAWACWRVYKMTDQNGKRDRVFLARAFQKLLLNFTWWVNQKDEHGKNLFSGGFLGLDNIGVFDRSRPLPVGGHLEQADATAWMAFYCGTMLSMALELASEDPSYEDVASKFFEHFVAITDAINSLGGSGLWDEWDNFYYDQLHLEDKSTPLRVRSLVGIIPLIAVEVLDDEVFNNLGDFKKRMQWFLDNRKDLAQYVSYMELRGGKKSGRRLLALPSRKRLRRLLAYVLNEEEFLSPHGIRSLSKIHKESPYTFKLEGQEYKVDYVPGESTTYLFGGNSNWRGPVWFPVNFLVVEALERYHHFYGQSFKVECPTGSGNYMNLKEVALDLSKRLVSIFSADPKTGIRASNASERKFAADPAWRDLALFYEYFHGDDGHGLGASHQTGWTSLVTLCFEKLQRNGQDGTED
jgi:hypothetical protein